MKIATKRLTLAPDAIAPDGSQVRLLLANSAVSMAHFTLQAGQISVAVRHRSIDELWYFVEGYGKLWRRQGACEDTVDVSAGICINIPVGTAFQFRANENSTLAAVGVTTPPWPGCNDEDTEAVIVDGIWTPTPTG